MGKPTGFLEADRAVLPRRSVDERITDSRQVDLKLSLPVLEEQASRCMDCGVPFCHQGCPLGNQIPEWNDAVYRGNYHEAAERLLATNNFPEFTGATCPAPCEDACVLDLHGAPVTIKQIEKQIATEDAVYEPKLPRHRTNHRVAVIGSGPAGLAAAQQLRRAGHAVTVFERDDRLGGLLRYGIPDFKLEKTLVDRRLAQLRAEGVEFRTGVDVGKDIPGDELLRAHDAVLVAVGAQEPRQMSIPGSELPGVVPAMEYLTAQNRAVAGQVLPVGLNARGRRVVILGGGDTGADCLGTAHRQGAAEVTHFHYKPAPPVRRTEDTPWPWVPLLLRDSSSHQEGGTRAFGVVAKAFEGDGRLERLRVATVDWEEQADGLSMVERPGTEELIDVDLCLIAIGFVGVTPSPLYAQLGIGAAPRLLHGDDRFRGTTPGVFVCGDARRGASLVVWAIWEGREAARSVDRYLMGESQLPTSPNLHPL
ncbi:MAG: glutamate synthase subunit beta [Myxococcota bacterium]